MVIVLALAALLAAVALTAFAIVVHRDGNRILAGFLAVAAALLVVEGAVIAVTAL